MASRDYGRIWEDFRATYGQWYSESYLREIHIRWKRIGSQVAHPGGRVG